MGEKVTSSTDYIKLSQIGTEVALLTVSYVVIIHLKVD